jgi:hypothetical protein
MSPGVSQATTPAAPHSPALAQPATESQPRESISLDPAEEAAAAVDFVFEMILGFLLPVFLATACGKAAVARSAILELIDAYDVATVRQLMLVGRIIAHSTAAMDDLRRSMVDPAMPDAQVLRLRGNAVALSRAADRCQKILETLQAQRPPRPRPIGVVAQGAVVPPTPVARPVAQSVSAPPPKTELVSGTRGISRTHGVSEANWAGTDIAAMKREVAAILAGALAMGERSATGGGPIADKTVAARSIGGAVSGVDPLTGKSIGVEPGDHATKAPASNCGPGR